MIRDILFAAAMFALIMVLGLLTAPLAGAYCIDSGCIIYDPPPVKVEVVPPSTLTQPSTTIIVVEPQWQPQNYIPGPQIHYSVGVEPGWDNRK